MESKIQHASVTISPSSIEWIVASDEVKQQWFQHSQALLDHADEYEARYLASTKKQELQLAKMQNNKPYLCTISSILFVSLAIIVATASSWFHVCERPTRNFPIYE